MKLHVTSTDLQSCVSCGLCLPHCPTYRVTQEEAWSPRGRIAAMRQVEAGLIALDDPEFVDNMDSCVQCRGCETACPSGVPFGRLMEGTRETLTEESSYQPWWRRLGYRALGHHRLLVAGSSLLALGQRLRLVPSRRLGLPERLPVRQPSLRSSGTDVVLFTGCVMDAWQRDIHASVKRVLEAAGVGVMVPGPGAACCGALSEHAGLGDHARHLARRVIDSLPPLEPILVDAAGCGAMLKDYGRLLDTPEAEAFSARVFDVHEWLADRVDRLPGAIATPEELWPHGVAIQDPCHLRHVQKAHQAVYDLLGRYVPIRVLDDEGLCCGAGGAYSVLRPETAGAIRDRKLGSIERAGAGVVASANPGCSMHLAAAGVEVKHPFELIDRALGLGEG
ncbi:MAG: 4Fe-4S dicluster domain-containing protein [Actinomycetia bacterium]|nr:4Fe-4S dicluster domain-containing protein [Actinomycetes bacterium]